MLLTESKISFLQHIFISLLIRIGLIIYSEIHDKKSEVPYTDIDYKVITDGARYILEEESPFKRHTFRYSPLLAYIVLPNLLIHKCFGKFVFAIFDIFVGILIQKIVYNELKEIFFETACSINAKAAAQGKKTIQLRQLVFPEKYFNWSKLASYLWLYNPLVMIISTRGSGDSFSSFFVLLTIYFMQKFHHSKVDSFLAGISHGIAIHLRIYPLIFSLALYLCLASCGKKGIFQIKKSPPSTYKRIFELILNKNQILLITGTITSLITLTGFFFYMYEWEYLQEAYIYHIFRKDTRHNFSLYFLMQYLTSDSSNKNDISMIIMKIFTILPQYVILLYLSLTFGGNRRTLSFCLFMQTFIMVTYNSVITSQYFIWYLALLPICMKNLRNISARLIITYFCLWILGQTLWLLPAYLLEFKALNTFNFIGIQSVCFFFVNIFILQRLIYNFDVFTRL